MRIVVYSDRIEILLDTAEPPPRKQKVVPNDVLRPKVFYGEKALHFLLQDNFSGGHTRWFTLEDANKFARSIGYAKTSAQATLIKLNAHGFVVRRREDGAYKWAKPIPKDWKQNSKPPKGVERFV